MRITQVTLAEIYDEIPNQDELIWEYVGTRDFASQAFQVVSIDPVQWFTVIQDVNGDTQQKIMEEHAQPEQKAYIETLRQELRVGVNLGYLVIDSVNNLVIDGCHRLAALALEGVRQYDYVVDLAELRSTPRL